MARKNISKTVRFEVFKRDNFQCVYCGKTPPNVTLEIDHMNPVFEGGTNEIDNLVTSCFDCNRGKRHIKLDKVPNSVLDNYEIIAEREAQYQMYQEMLKNIRQRIDIEINDIELVFRHFTNDRWYFIETFKYVSVKNFLEKLGFESTRDAMQVACQKFLNKDGFIPDSKKENCISYFCGICWNKIKELQNGR